MTLKGFAATTPWWSSGRIVRYMTSEIDEFRQSLVAAVQAELERHASAVVAEVDRLRSDGQRQRAELKSELAEQVAGLVETVEQVQTRSESYVDRTREVLEQRLEDSDSRQTRRLDDVAGALEGLVQQAVRPLMADVGEQQDVLATRVEGLDTNLRKFDEQAARMVTYFNEMSQQMEVRQDELSDTLKTDIATQIDGLKKLVEENDSAVRRFQNEVGQSVTQKLNDAEDRFNNRLLAAESRVKEESGQKIAEIDAHVGKVSKGLDDTMTVLNERVAALDDRFVDVGRRIDEVEKSVGGIDEAVLDELKEKMSSAVGEAMLVRIEMERLEKGVNEKTDTLAVRMTDLETQVQDSTMDVSTAVQLDRLEEIERSLLELDPSKFVLKNENLKIDAKDADASNGIDATVGTDGT